MDNDCLLQLRTAQEYVRAAQDAFRWNHRHLSGDQLDLEWNRLWSSSGVGVGYPPDLPRTVSWTGCIGDSSQLTSSDDTLPLEMTRSQGLSTKSAPETLARNPSTEFGCDMYSTMSTSSSHYPASSAHRTASSGNYTASPAPRPSRKRHRDPLPKVVEQVVEYEPSDYITAISETADSTTTNPALLAHGLPANYQDRTYLSVTTTPMLDRSYSYDGSSSPSTPATALTDASTQSSQMMSRNGSIASTQSAVNPSFLQTVDMLRLNSNMSSFPYAGADGKAPYDVSTDFSDEGLDTFTSSHQSDQKYLVAHDGQDLDLDISPTSAFTFSSSAPNSASFSSQLSPSSDTTLLKHNSWSSQCSESDSSTSQSRSSRRHQEQIRQANNCPIAPKVNSSKKSAPMVRVESSDGSVQVKALISRKTPYQRPQHPKLFCPYCKDHPDGFRGEHELQRHTNRAHPSGIRKVWICEEIYGNGDFLANCKACKTKKRYGAYYNAAAHLRRAHFNPRKRGRKAKTDAEKRGGKGGGNWPAMDFLKDRWMREIEEVVTENSPPVEYDNSSSNLDVEDEQVLTDQLSISPESVSPAEDYSNLWQDSAFQFTAAEGLGDPAYDIVNYGSGLSYDLHASQHGAFADPDTELYELESFRWTQ